MIKPPKISIEYLGKSNDAEFLRIKHNKYRLKYTNGEISDEFTYDSVDRKNIDAVIILAHYGAYIYLRSAVRPALLERGENNLWELPAGLIEPGEDPIDTARRETEEELGFTVERKELRELGHYTLPSVGLIGERIYFFSVAVNPQDRKEPSLDGSPLEKYGEVKQFELTELLRLIDEGEIKDAKTELGVRRFYSKYFQD